MTDQSKIKIEAEHMREVGFHEFSGSNASGGKGIRLDHLGGSGDVFTDFTGEAGTYDVTIRAQDESDGQSMIKVGINGVEVGVITLDNDNNGGGSNNGHFQDFVLEGVEINPGDRVSFWVDGDAGEYVRLDYFSFEEVEAPVDPVDPVDPNMVCIDFNDLAAGETVSDQYDGVTIVSFREQDLPAANGENHGMVFDGANPTGGDTDLTASGDNVLIISEDGDANDPDDNAAGGRLWFMFDEPGYMSEIKILDAEEGGRIGLVTTDQGTVWIDIPGGQDGGIQTITLDVDNVTKLDVILNGSGAVDDLKYIPGEAPELGSIAGTVFMDNNDNSVQDAGDMDLSGVQVDLWSVTERAIVGTTTTDANGNYLFEGLDAATYRVIVRNEDDNKVYVDANVGGDDTIDSDISEIRDDGVGLTGRIVLGQGENVTDVDAGLENVAPAVGSLSGRFFMDTDGNDRDNNNGDEPAIEGVLVMLLDANGNPTGDQVFTDANGEYTFADLPAGDYGVKFTDPNGVLNGKELVDPNWNNNALDDRDSDAIGDTTESVIEGITVTAGNDTPDNDAGARDVAPVLGSLAGTVFMDNNDNSILDGADMAIEGVTVILRDASGDEVARLTTDADGNYVFEDLPAGDYSVVFGTKFTGKVNVDANVGNDEEVDSDVITGIGENVAGTTGTITLGEGENITGVNSGLEEAAPEVGSLSGRFFMDLNGNDRDNNNGSDPAIEGVLVMLLDANGNPTGDQVFTDANGEYTFADLPAGDYGVKFTDPNGVLDGKELVDPNWNNNALDDRDSDAIGDTTESVIEGITVTAGNDTPDNDAGARDLPPELGSLGGTYFMDNNDNSVQDAGDMAIAGATVWLIKPGQGIVATTTTDANGNYLFENLEAGDYRVRFDEQDGKSFVDGNVGGDDTIDSDVTLVGGAGNGNTDFVSVGAGEDVRNVDAGVEVVDTGSASIGNKVFLDANGNGQQDAGEQGVNGVQVTLFNAAGMAISTITTTNGGMYLFDNLDAGDYSVGFEAPDGFDLTDANVGNDASDSDADQGTGRTETISLEIGEADLTVDAGLVAQNNAPNANDDDAGKACADQDITVDVLANDTDADGDTLSVTAVNGQAIAEGQTINVDGVDVSLVGGSLVFNGEAAFEALNVGEEATVNYTYTVSDGNGGTGTANVEVGYCGVAETIQDICDSLPSSINYQIVNEYGNGNDGAFTVKIDSSGDARLDGLIIEAGYCVSAFDPAGAGSTFDNAPLYSADLYCTEDDAAMATILAGQTGINGQSAADNMDLVNWILNQEFSENGYTDAEVQGAIWSLTDSIDFVLPEFGDLADVQEIVALAEANGEGFEAGPGGIVGLLIDPNPATDANSQPFVLAVDFDSLDCLC